MCVDFLKHKVALNDMYMIDTKKISHKSAKIRKVEK